MPIILVKVAPRSDKANLEPAIADKVAEISTRVLKKRADLTAVAVERVAPASWFAGGISLADHAKASFWLEIKVVEGTNTKDEKAAFIAEVFEAMKSLLGDLHEESYVHVHEVKADAYGFGGLTQERRYIAAKLGLP